MKIPSLPQVVFDEFPSDDSTKVCIFTQPQYPVPDLSKSVRKPLLCCTELTTFFLASFPKKLPFELFRLLPDTPTQWMKFESSTIDGLDTPFAIACIPTGSVSGSVMLLIFILDKPDELILYTGKFKTCHTVILSDMLLKYKRKINDIYLDNTMANSLHFDIAQDNRACDDIKKIIEKYPDCDIHLQTEMFDSLDLLVNLARRHRINVKLKEFQQIFIYRTQYKDLFEFDSKIITSSAKNLNENFQFKDRPKVNVRSPKVCDLDTYKKLFKSKKILNIRLIPSTQRVDTFDGLIFVEYSPHASAYTISQMLDIVKPKRVHPMIEENEIHDNFHSKMSESILNDGCEIVNRSEEIRDLPEVTLNDINPAKSMDRGERSFLDESTLLSDSSEDVLIVSENDAPVSKVPVNVEPAVAQTSNDELTKRFPEHDTSIDFDANDDVILIDSDSDSGCLEAMLPKRNKRHSNSFPRPGNNSKIFKAWSTTAHGTSSHHSVHDDSIEYDSDDSSTDSKWRVVFPDNI